MGDFTLRDFAETYVGVALEAARNNPTMNAFYIYVYTEVAKRTGLSSEDVKYLHHPFHWTLFLEQNHPLEMIDSPKSNGDSRARIKKDADVSPDLISRILEKHGIMLEERFRKISDNQTASIPAR